ncbi:hypothetical protein FSE90_04240 [Campylobacter novaezeelandiae]|nr:hypothetical protein [Campylobacter novaezeelandiae]
MKFKLQDLNTCKFCLQSVLEKDAKFCIFCGAELNHPAKQRFDYIYDKNPALW